MTEEDRYTLSLVLSLVAIVGALLALRFWSRRMNSAGSRAEIDETVTQMNMALFGVVTLGVLAFTSRMGIGGDEEWGPFVTKIGSVLILLAIPFGVVINALTSRASARFP